MNIETIKKVAGNFDNLYDTASLIYGKKKPISRLLYIAKIKDQGVSKDDKHARENTLNNFREEIKGKIKKLDSDDDSGSNVMMIFFGIAYAFIGIEVIFPHTYIELEFK